uniref:Putative sigma-70 region domain containing protein n=1 Tax=viral metagenome TaxID=1070528 RepID=A0A6M3L6R0_9ZZZZ
MDSDTQQTIDVAALTKLKHGALRDAAVKLGSQSALAKELNVTPSTIGRWCNFKDYPREGRIYDKHSFESIEKALLRVTGHLVDDLWPPALKAAIDDRLIPQQIERRATIQAEALLEYAAHTQERLTYNPDEGMKSASRNELKDNLRKVLNSLTQREREIIKLRYGLDDGQTYTFREVGAIFKITQERVRQIEAKALRKLEQPSRAQHLVGHLD